MKTRVALASLASLLVVGMAAPAAQASDQCVYDVNTGQDIACVPTGPLFLHRYLTEYFQVYYDHGI